VVPRRDPAVGAEPLLDFSSGYVQRALHMLPKQGTKRPWKLRQNYALDLLAFRFGAVEVSIRPRPRLMSAGVLATFTASDRC
jgi:monooxygenase